MPVTLQVPNEYGYVLLAATSTIFVHVAHMLNTGKFRKAAQIAYPASYATLEQQQSSTDAYLFNCAQRAHANFTENHLTTLTPLLITGLKWPIPAAVCGFIWSAGRYVYMKGYCDPARVKEAGKGRYDGMFQYLGSLPLLGMLITMSVQMVMGK